MVAGTALEFFLHVVLEIANQELGHEANDSMISLWRVTIHDRKVPFIAAGASFMTEMRLS
jgi:hypothetical protein